MVLVGCKVTTNPKPLTRDEIYKGTDGLVMSFWKDTPPKEVYASTDTERAQFDIAIELQNKGAYNIEQGWLTLVLENDYMLIDEWKQGEHISYSGDSRATFDLEGKSLLNPIGGKDLTTIRINANKFPETLSETHTSSILLAACYKYQTSVYENVCVDTDVYNLRNLDKPCNVKDMSLTSQGAPIAITKVEVQMMPHENQDRIKPIFTIYVENKGNGEVIKSGVAIENACSSGSLRIKENDINVVDIKAYLSGREYQLDCNPGYVKLKEKQGVIRCSLKDGKEKQYGTYEAPLIIDLDYGYMQTIAKEVTIKKPVTY